MESGDSSISNAAEPLEQIFWKRARRRTRQSRVWWDQDILPGQDWKMEIRQAMRNAYDVVVCLSQETAGRITSGIYPEVPDAIGACRKYSPGGIFLVPVKLSACDIPLIKLDATRTLDPVQHVELFPDHKRAENIQKLIAALQATSLHP